MARAGWVAAAAALLSGTGCLSLGREEAMERIREDGPILRVDIELDAGNVQIIGAGEAGASGTVTTRWTDSPPEIVHYVEDGVLHVLGRCEAYQSPCIVELALTVPTTANVGIQTGIGDVTVRGIDGDVEIGSGEGKIDANAIGGTFFAETDDGDLVGEGLRGNLVDGRTGGGDVELRLTAVPQRVVGRTDDGDVTLVVPAGPYRIESDTPKGDLSLSASIVDDPAATSVIVAETDNGDVVISTKDGAPAKPQKED